MKYTYIKKQYLGSLNELLESLKPEFLPRKKSRKLLPLYRYMNNPKLKMIIAVDDNLVIGYKSYRFDGKTCRFLGLGVDKRYRRKGIADKFYDITIADAMKNNMRRIITTTWNGNERSKALFIKRGFKKYRTIKNDRIDGSDTIWYKLILKKN